MDLGIRMYFFCRYGYPPSYLYRVPGFLFCRPNWVPPPLHPQGSVASPTFGSKGEGVWGPNSDEGTDTLVLDVYYIIPVQLYRTFTAFQDPKSLLFQNKLDKDYFTVNFTGRSFRFISTLSGSNFKLFRTDIIYAGYRSGQAD
jgi:hypothetical protein